jgi:hypothetical protein
MGETRKIAAILVADIVGYSRLAGSDEDRTLRSPRKRASVRSSSAPARRLYPTTSATRIAASLRVSLIAPLSG